MEKLTGKSIGNGIAIGRIRFYSKNCQPMAKIKVDNIEGEIARYEDAKQKAIDQLHQLHDKAVATVGEEDALIFEVHAMLLEDAYYNESVYDIIRSEAANAEYAVVVTGHRFESMFARMEDEYLQARASDVKDVSERVIAVLTGADEAEGIGDEPVIVVAEDLSPAETVQMDKSKVLAFVTHMGSAYSHMAIFAKTMNIPALFGVEIAANWNGKIGIVDGKKGEMYVDPDMPTLEFYREECRKNEEQRKLLWQLKGQSDETKDGKHISLYANIGSIADVADVLANDAAGIGLFRSEFLYLEKEDYPTEEEQFQVYKTVVQKMTGKRVVIRTLDIGADKQANYFNLEPEENPALGYRGIRICLDRVDMFKTQLRAIYRASAYGNVAIMFPMIISVDEVRRIKQMCEEVRRELTECGVALGELELGIMIETPAAVMISDLLAGEVDFFSIGTNDLTQYTLAMDRQNPKLDSMYNPYHPAVLRMIQMVIDNGHRENCHVGICGELGADLTLTEKLIKMGIDELSVSPNMVLPLRNVIVNMNVND